MNRGSIPFWALIIVMAAGCSLAPSYKRPALPTAQVYPEEFGGTTRVAFPVEQLGWRDFFTDTRLQELIAQALENNRDLRVAMRRVEEARAQYGIQRADQLSSIMRAPPPLGGS